MMYPKSRVNRRKYPKRWKCERTVYRSQTFSKFYVQLREIKLDLSIYIYTIYTIYTIYYHIKFNTKVNQKALPLMFSSQKEIIENG
jgi:hypothetical protein